MPIRRRTLWLLISLLLPLAAIGFYAPLIFGFGGNQGPLLFLFAPAFTIVLAPFIGLLSGVRAVTRSKDLTVQIVFVCLLTAVFAPSLMKIIPAVEKIKDESLLFKPKWVRMQNIPPLSDAERSLLRLNQPTYTAIIENPRLPPAYADHLIRDLRATAIFRDILSTAEKKKSDPDRIVSIEVGHSRDSWGTEFTICLASDPERKIYVNAHYEPGGKLTWESDRRQYLDRLAVKTLKAIQELQQGGGSAEPWSIARDNHVKRAALAKVGTGTFSPRIAVVSDDTIVVAASSFIQGYYHLISAAFKQDGQIDRAFGENGFTKIWFNSAYTNTTTHALVVEAVGQGAQDGVVIGELMPRDPEPHISFLAKFTPKGADQSFGYGGTTRFAIRRHDDIPAGLALQQDGKIIISANSGGDSNIHGKPVGDLALLRLEANGQGYDRTFGRNGVVIEKDRALTNHKAAAVALLPDGKILMGSYSTKGKGTSAAMSLLIRYQPNGQRDKSFGVNGIVKISPSLLMEGIAVQNDQHILTYGRSDENRMRVLLRLRPDGEIDKTYGYDGYVVLPYAYGRSVIAIQPDGKTLLLDGYISTFPPSSKTAAMRVIRINPDGGKDSTFGIWGTVYLKLEGMSFWPEDLRLASDGSILIAGMRNLSQHSRPNYTDQADILLVRLDVSGRVDHNFGVDLSVEKAGLQGKEPNGEAAAPVRMVDGNPAPIRTITK